MTAFVFDFAATLAVLLVKVAPYFLLGALFAALLKVYVRPAWTERFFTRGASSVFYASLAGALLPGCSCATMPMSDGVKAQGGQLGTVTGFIIISPLLSPITIAMTYAMLGWKMTYEGCFRFHVDSKTLRRLAMKFSLNALLRA